MPAVLAFVRREVAALGGVALGAIELALAHGATPQVALQAALPVVLGAAVRQLTQPTPTQGDPMADLSALSAAVVQLQSDAQSVGVHVAQLKAEATPQADVDAVTAQVQAASQQLQTAVQ